MAYELKNPTDAATQTPDHRAGVLFPRRTQIDVETGHRVQNFPKYVNQHHEYKKLSKQNLLTRAYRITVTQMARESPNWDH
jgi:hypothetical protein